MNTVLGAISFVYLVYLVSQLAYFIGACVRDAFVRPYVGDVLVTALLGCMIRTVWPDRWKLLGLEGTVLAVMMGSSFSRADILCYALGCILFWLFDRLCGNSTR